MEIHQPLLESLNSIASAYPPKRSKPVPIPASELESKLSQTWETYSNDPSLINGMAKNPDLIRGVLELVGREFVVLSVINGELREPDETANEKEKNIFQTALRDRLDIVLTLYENVHKTFQEIPFLEPGALFIPLLEELVELLSVSTWRSLWSYVESRSKRFTKDMPASRGKALPLLRTINAFLRFLPRTPEDLVFRGRIHQFASSVFSVADKSAINMRGDYSEVKTVWEKESEVEQIKEEKKKKKEGKMEEKAEEGGKKDGDVEMEDAEKKDEPAEQQADRPTGRSTYQAADQSMEQMPTEDEAPSTPSTLKDPDFYSTLWSLQQYFSHPPSLDGPAVGSPPKTPFQTFRDKSDFILFQLFEQTKKEKAMTGTEDGMGKKRKRDVMEGGQDTGGFFHPRFLTGKRLFEYELADSSFRRQILVQYFILFQFLLNLTPAHAGKQAFTGGMPRTFMLEQTDEQWVKSKIGGIKDELKRIVGGVSFEDTVFSIIRQEAHYVQWKNEGCPEASFEIPALDPDSASEPAQAWAKRLNPPTPYNFKVGSRPLSMLWNNGFTNIDQLKGREKATTVEALDEEIKRIEEDEEDDKAM
ncbi:THO complex subunit 1, partial [Cryptococcus neoformans]